MNDPTMRITIIHGQSHEGSTCHMARLLAEKLHGTVTEFFLPRDFGSFCMGCGVCFQKSEALCPHAKQLAPITQAIDQADLLILASPVYVYHATGAMKALLDHYGYRWMVHRPEPGMFRKQAVCVSTAAGAGMSSTNRDMADSLFFWGVRKIYRWGMAVAAVSYEQMSDAQKRRGERQAERLARRIRSGYGKTRPSLKTRGFFRIMRMLQKRGWNEADVQYWQAKGWDRNARPWN